MHLVALLKLAGVVWYGQRLKEIHSLVGSHIPNCRINFSCNRARTLDRTLGALNNIYEVTETV